MSDLKAIQFSLARALEDGGGGDEEAAMYVSEITACIEERIIKLLEAFDTCYCAEDDPNPKHYRCGTNQGLIPQEIIALIKGGNK